MSSAMLRAAARKTALRPSVLRTQLRARPSAFRTYSTGPEAETKSSSRPIIIAAGAIVAAAAAAYALDIGGIATSGSSTKVALKFTPTQEDYQKVYNDIVKVIDDAGDYDDGSYGPLLLRLAWHCSGTYDKDIKSGGSNFATMRFHPESIHGANAGLALARNLMDKVKEKYPWISYGDLWTLAGVAAVQEMSGPKVPWRPGRVDGFAEDATPDGRLPDATQGSDHLRKIFYRMGFNDQEIVALSGAHALGRCHTDRSGFTGPWTFSPTTVTNDYFKLLFNEKWSWKKWDGPRQLEDKSTKTLMMLPTDYVLTQDKSFKKYAKAYADDQDLFFKDFASVVSRLFELGVPEKNWVSQTPWIMKSADEQQAS